MAEGKKSFLLYCDLIHTVNLLSDEKAGELFKHVLDYVNDKNPETECPFIKLTFEPIKQSLKRDLKKYEKIVGRNRLNGSLGGRPKNPEKPKKPSGLITNPKNPEKPDSDNDSDIDIINSYVKEIKNSEDYLNNFYRRYSLEKGAAFKLLEEFKQHLAMNPTEHAHFSEFRKHFNNWIQIMNNNKQLEKYKTQKSGAL